MYSTKKSTELILKNKEVNEMAHIIYCPVNGWDCPYFKNNFCTIENPEENCDDFALIADFFSDLDDEEDELDYEDELRDDWDEEE